MVFRKKVDSSVVIELRRKFPCYTATKIAEQVGLSRERVRQILKKHNERTRKIAGYCRTCSNVLTNRQRKYCSPECRHKDTYVQVSCSVCGKMKEVRAKYLIGQTKRGYQDFHCSNKCKSVTSIGVEMKKRAARHVLETRWLTCPQCGKKFDMMPAKIRYKLKISPDTRHIYCGRPCFNKAGGRGGTAPCNIPIDILEEFR